MRMETILSCGQTTWFASQTSRDLLSPFHALICPEPHISNACEMEESMWAEIRDIKKCFRLMLLGCRAEVWQEVAKWSSQSESDDGGELDDPLVAQILAEHQLRENLTAQRRWAEPVAQIGAAAAASSSGEAMRCVFFEFHLPREHEADWRASLLTGGHYTVDCLAVRETEFEQLKMALINEFKIIQTTSEHSTDLPGQSQRVFKKLESRAFLKREIPNPRAPPPYLYFDFGLEEAYLLILAPGDLTKKGVRDFIQRSLRPIKKPDSFDFALYLNSFKQLYRPFDCFRPDQ